MKCKNCGHAIECIDDCGDLFWVHEGGNVFQKILGICPNKNCVCGHPKPEDSFVNDY
jgi:hypothetical protein